MIESTFSIYVSEVNTAQIEPKHFEYGLTVYKPYVNASNSRSEIRWINLHFAEDIKLWKIVEMAQSKYELAWWNHSTMYGNYRPVFDDRCIKADNHYRRHHLNQFVQDHQTTGISFETDFFPVDPIVEDLVDRLVYSECQDQYLWDHQATEIEIVDRNGRGETTYADNEYIDDHLTKCSDCDRYSENCNSTDIDHYTDVCPACRDNNYTTCESCDRWIHNDNSFYSESSGEVYCERCHEEDSEDDREYYQPTQIERYHDWQQCRRAKTAYPVPFAIEIEGESQYSGSDKYEALERLIDEMTRAAHLQWTREGFDYSQYKSLGSSGPDGSLSNTYGFELETQYLRFETLQAMFSNRQVIDAYDDIFDQRKMNNNEAIGLHISFPESAMSRTAVLKMSAAAAHLDTDEGDTAAYEIFGRQPSAYSTNRSGNQKPVRLATGKYNGHKSGPVCIRNKAYKNGSTLTEKYGRIELRFPRSAWTAKSLLERLEAIMSFVLWAMDDQANALANSPQSHFDAYRAYHANRMETVKAKASRKKAKA